MGSTDGYRSSVFWATDTSQQINWDTDAFHYRYGRTDTFNDTRSVITQSRDGRVSTCYDAYVPYTGHWQPNVPLPTVQDIIWMHQLPILTRTFQNSTIAYRYARWPHTSDCPPVLRIPLRTGIGPGQFRQVAVIDYDRDNTITLITKSDSRTLGRAQYKLCALMCNDNRHWWCYINDMPNGQDVAGQCVLLDDMRPARVMSWTDACSTERHQAIAVYLHADHTRTYTRSVLEQHIREWKRMTTRPTTS